MKHSLVCPDCGRGAKLIDSAAIYGTSYGLVYVCEGYPQCDTYVGVHRGTENPKGTLAGPELRAWRKRAHAAFDPLWKSGEMTRRAAYQMMRDYMNLTPDEGHIGCFDIETCRRLVSIFEPSGAVVTAPEGSDQ